MTYIDINTAAAKYTNIANNFALMHNIYVINSALVIDVRVKLFSLKSIKAGVPRQLGNIAQEKQVLKLKAEDTIRDPYLNVPT